MPKLISSKKKKKNDNEGTIIVVYTCDVLKTGARQLAFGRRELVLLVLAPRDYTDGETRKQLCN